MTIRSPLLAILFCLLSLPGLAAPALSPEVSALLDEGDELMAQRQFDDAIRSFRRAAKKAGSDCLDCSLGLARGYRSVGAYRDALDHAQEALPLAKDPLPRAVAHSEIGLAQLGLGDKGSPEVAAEHFRKAITLDPKASPSLYFNLGYSLLKAGKDEEGVAALEELLEIESHTRLAKDARALIREPRRAREDLVPDFRATTLEGRSLSPEDFEGKVVLYDFWATWCGPCHQALPNLRRLNKKMQDSPFVLVSISADRDETTLRNFVEKEKMHWPQIHDKFGDLTGESFRVTGFPTYILVDHEGRIIFRRSGWSPGIDTEVSMRVRKAMKKMQKADADG